MTKSNTNVTGGVDTHKDVHVAAVVDETGRILSTDSFPTTSKGYQQLLTWMGTIGTVQQIGVEGTGSYGAGLTRYLTAKGVPVVEVNRPNRQARRRRGKTDLVDAKAAARAALNGEATAKPKVRDGLTESIRVIQVAFRSARNTRTRVSNQIRDLTLTSPDHLRAVLKPLSSPQRAAHCARFRPGDITDSTQATKTALRALARRYQTLTVEINQLRDNLDQLTAQANPALRAAHGVGTDVASILLIAAGEQPGRLSTDASFAALCGASPVEASSGKTIRHRLNQGGNRQANHALWRIATVRLISDPETKAYAARRTTQGKTRREIIRCLKRSIAREIHQLLTNPPTVPNGPKLRTTRTAAGISLQTAANALNTWPTRLSQLERNLDYNTKLAQKYQTWLKNNHQPT